MAKKKYQVITYDEKDGGADEKLEYSSVKKADSAARQYHNDGYKGALVYDLDAQRIICEYGQFAPGSKPLERQRAIFMKHQLDLCKLMSRAELLEYLRQNDPTDHSLSVIRTKYELLIGIDPIWRFPLSDGKHMGTVIVPVKEGFLSLPYDEIDAEEYEIYLPDESSLMTAESYDVFCSDLTSYTAGFCHAMQEAKKLITNNNEV